MRCSDPGSAPYQGGWLRAGSSRGPSAATRSGLVREQQVPILLILHLQPQCYFCLLQLTPDLHCVAVVVHQARGQHCARER